MLATPARLAVLCTAAWLLNFVCCGRAAHLCRRCHPGQVLRRYLCSGTLGLPVWSPATGSPFCLCWVLALGQSAGPASGPLAWRSPTVPCQHSRRLPRPVSEQTGCLQWCCTWGLAFLRLPEPCPPSPACLALIPGSALIPRTCKGHDGPGLTAPAAEREARLLETIGPPAAPRPPYQGRPPVYEVPRPENAAEHAGPAFIHGHFCVLCPSVQGEVVTIALRAPCECDFALSEINEARFPERCATAPSCTVAAGGCGDRLGHAPVGGHPSCCLL